VDSRNNLRRQLHLPGQPQIGERGWRATDSIDGGVGSGRICFSSISSGSVGQSQRPREWGMSSEAGRRCNARNSRDLSVSSLTARTYRRDADERPKRGAASARSLQVPHALSDV